MRSFLSWCSTLSLGYVFWYFGDKNMLSNLQKKVLEAKDTQLEFNIISSNKQPSLFLIDKNCLSAELQERRNTVFPKLAMALD